MRILISGAGIAGLTLAYWLDYYGYDVEIIEKEIDFQSRRGYLITFWGEGYEIAEQMNILHELKQKDHMIPELIYMNKIGEKSATLGMTDLRKIFNNRFHAFFRGDLIDVLLKKIKNKVQVYSGMEINDILNEKEKISVVFSNGSQEDYDLVIGADGVHSNVRRLIFGDENLFSKYLGYQFGIFIHSRNNAIANALYAYAIPEKQVAICPISKKLQATFFIYKSLDKSSTNDREQLYKKFHDSGWVVPDILESIKRADEVFFDALTQVQMPTWHKGRVALIGDACQCLSLMGGQGASMGMTGAYVLATMLHRNNTDYEQAFSSYQQLIKPHIESKQRSARKFIRSFVPDTQFGINCRNFFSEYINAPFVSRMLFKGLLQRKLGSVDNSLV